LEAPKKISDPMKIQAFGPGNPQHLHPTPSKYTHLKPAKLRPVEAFNSQNWEKFPQGFWVKITSYQKITTIGI